ncbi:50S ribosomal protein L6, partial [bacterium]|nr:50S ribosomal protein L6 [bacterium]
MSRIGKNPIPLPTKVSVEINGLAVKVKGPKGELNRVLPEGVVLAQEDNLITVNPADGSRRARERHGLCRTLVANMVEGVSAGFTRKLEIIGVGYRAS